MPQFQPRHAIPAKAGVEPVAARFGAPMGWSNTPTHARLSCPVNVRLERVPIVDGYDPAGSYYGEPADLWEAQAEGRASFRFRASNLDSAKAEVRKFYAAATFAPTVELDQFAIGYLAAAEWLMSDDADPDSGEVSAERRSKARGWTKSTLRDARADCAEFMEANAADLAAYTESTGRDMESAGHDFWLTRNGHGAGFWDRGSHPCLERLSNAARRCGERDARLDRNAWMTIA